MTHTYQISGMHCQSCVARVTQALESVPDITAAKVTLDPPRARVEMSRHVDTETLSKAAQSAGGYRLSEARSEPEVMQLGGMSTPAPADRPRESLYPLVLIVGYILGTVLVVAFASSDWAAHSLMRHFMGGFFLVFSFFKLLDLPGFAGAYRMYDVVAQRVPVWGLVYPFIELALGVAYLLNVQPFATNLVTLVLMLVGAVGVLQSLMQKKAIRCACLGTALNLPMTTVTLVEDLGMAAMAAVMLVA